MCPDSKENCKKADKKRIDQSRDEAVLKRRISFLEVLSHFLLGPRSRRNGLVFLVAIFY